MQARHTLIDAFKATGAQLIVLHHYVAYGPLADDLHRAAPTLALWLYDYARMAVQIFLVLGGYLAVQSLTATMRGPSANLWRAVLGRYLRLALPFAFALLLAVLAAAVARPWLQADVVPASPQWGQLLSHLTLLHGVLQSEALSAGGWYVAIDLQLYVLLALLLWLGQRGGRRWPALLLVVGLMLASLLYFNRDPAWDDWAWYFFGSYALGALTWRAGRARRPLLSLGLLVAVGLLALALDWRPRIAIALGLALLLGLMHGQAWTLPRLPDALGRTVHSLGRSSYALFLVHFPVLLLINALHAGHGANSAAAALALLALGWLLSLLLAREFERRIERPLCRYVATRLRPPASN